MINSAAIQSAAHANRMGSPMNAYFGLSAEGMPYVYSGLPSTLHIRVLILKPSQNPIAPLRFSFRIGDVKELMDKYEALSYTWGAPNFRHKLYNDDIPDSYLKITSNLRDALTKLRLPFQVQLIWADAVCINQQDQNEKSFQIPMMGEIYRNARAVVIWLGQGDSNVEDAINKLSELSRAPLVQDPKVYQLALERVVRLEYFSRRWIIQELVMNHDATLLYSNASISWIRFQTVFRSLQGTMDSIENNDYLNIVSRIITLWSFWTEVDMLSDRDPDQFHDTGSRTPRTSVFDLLPTFDLSQCCDPRDILYTLITLATDLQATGSSSEEEILEFGHPIVIAVSYTDDVETVYTKFAQAAVSANKGRNILKACLTRPRSPKSFSAKFPSWVPDWRIPAENGIDVNIIGFTTLYLDTGAPSRTLLSSPEWGSRVSLSGSFHPFFISDALPAHGVAPNKMTETLNTEILMSVQSFWTRNAHTNKGRSSKNQTNASESASQGIYPEDVSDVLTLFERDMWKRSALSMDADDRILRATCRNSLWVTTYDKGWVLIGSARSSPARGDPIFVTGSFDVCFLFHKQIGSDTGHQLLGFTRLRSFKCSCTSSRRSASCKFERPTFTVFISRQVALL